LCRSKIPDELRSDLIWNTEYEFVQARRFDLLAQLYSLLRLTPFGANPKVTWDRNFNVLEFGRACLLYTEHQGDLALDLCCAILNRSHDTGVFDMTSVLATVIIEERSASFSASSRVLGKTGIEHGGKASGLSDTMRIPHRSDQPDRDKVWQLMNRLLPILERTTISADDDEERTLSVITTYTAFAGVLDRSGDTTREVSILSRLVALERQYHERWRKPFTSDYFYRCATLGRRCERTGDHAGALRVYENALVTAGQHHIDDATAAEVLVSYAASLYAVHDARYAAMLDRAAVAAQTNPHRTSYLVSSIKELQSLSHGQKPVPTAFWDEIR
jgi:hypothetical protein